MIEETARAQRETTEKVFKRRGVLAAAGAVVAGIVATQATQPVLAANVPIIVSDTPNSGIQNNLVSPVLIAENGGFNLASSPHVLSVMSSTANVDAIYGNAQSGGTGKGVYGRTNSGYGVYGAADGDGGYGVMGIATNAYGVIGQSTSGTGVRGQIPVASGAAGTIAVYGENLSTNTGGSPGNGGFGCYGFSAKGHGLVGATGTAGGGALVGSTNGVPGAYAAIFYGPIAVVGGGKSAAVKNTDGSHSLLYCVESPESWFEDFGKGTLVGGKAAVKIDPAFAAVADLSDYHVFLTVYGRTACM